MNKKSVKPETIIKAAEYVRNIPDRYWNIKDTERLINSIYRDLDLMDMTPEGLQAAFHFSSDKKEMLKRIQEGIEVLKNEFGKCPDQDLADIIHKLKIFAPGLDELI